MKQVRTLMIFKGACLRQCHARFLRAIRPTVILFGLGICGSLPVPSQANGLPQMDVDAAIVFAIDMSSSIDPARADFQRMGHVDALRSPEVAAAITRGNRGCIAITYVEWSVPGWMRTILPWTAICNDADRRKAAEEIARNGDTGIERRGRGGTAISYALEASAILLDRLPVHADRKIIDISANGTSNQGLPVASARDRVLAKDYIINAIVIDKTEPGVSENLPGYFRENVIGGPGSFVVSPQSISDYAHALRRKLVYEISDRLDSEDATLLRIADAAGHAIASNDSP